MKVEFYLNIKGDDNVELWWKCPNCKGKVNFSEEASYVFDPDDGEADFSPEKGLYFHTIVCSCGANWTMSISNMEVIKM